MTPRCSLAKGNQIITLHQIKNTEHFPQSINSKVSKFRNTTFLHQPEYERVTPLLPMYNEFPSPNLGSNLVVQPQNQNTLPMPRDFPFPMCR